MRAETAAAPCSKAAAPWVLAATILGSSITFIDGTVVGVALPVLQRELGTDIAGAQWIVEAYALMLSALILVGGSLGDRLGRRRIFSLGLLLFAITSAGCGLAQTTGQLIFGRAVQGVGAAMLVPGSLAIISASFSKEDRGRAIGTWSGFTAIAAGVGPVLGGWLVENVSCRSRPSCSPSRGGACPRAATRVPESVWTFSARCRRRSGWAASSTG